MTHLDTLRLVLSRERTRLAMSTTRAERAVRSAWADQLAREVAAEERFIGVAELPALDEDDLLAELLA